MIASRLAPRARRATAPDRTPASPAPVGRAAGRLVRLPGDVWAVLALVALGLVLFGPHLLGLSTFVGNSDRLHTFLNVRKLEVDMLQALGRVPPWDGATFLGTPTYGLHWMFPGLDPAAALAALFPARDVFRVSGSISAAHVIAAALAAYLFIRDVVRSPFAAVVGAGLYACSAFSIHRISQVDAAFAVLIFQPLGLLVLRRLRPGGAALGFVALAAIVTGIVGFTFLQEAAYILIFFGLYACWRLVLTRDWRPFVVLGAAGLVGVSIAVPRLGTVVEDIREVSRTSSLIGTCPCELLRWFEDGIYGRFPQEAAALGNGINLHEGFQLHTSTFAALAVMVGLFRSRGVVSVLLGGAFAGLLAFIASLIAGRGHLVFPYDLWLVPIALTLWGLLRGRVARLAGMPRGFAARDRDLWFFTAFVALVFAIVLYDEARYWLYLAFFRVDFSHSRISAAALLPLSLLAAVFVRELAGRPAASGEPTPGEQPAGARRDGLRAHCRALAAGAALAVVLVLLLDPLASVAATALLGPVERVGLGTWIFISTRELGRLAVSVAVFLVVLVWHWCARHVRLVRGADAFEVRWLDGARPDATTTLRLLPAYVLGCLMLVQAAGNAYFAMNGPHTQTFPVPFLGNNNFTVPTEALRPPSPFARQALHDRLETDRYRSVVVSAPDGYPTYDAPSERGYTAHVAQFWQLRLVEGYPMLPRRLAELPWPDANRSLRSLYFADQTALPWPLLAILNVKYAVVASPGLLLNVPANPASFGGEARPADLTILENPLPVLPRAFFAESVVPRLPPATPPAPSLPPAPAAIRATVQSDRSLVISWLDERHDARYRVFRRQVVPDTGQSELQIGETSRGGRSFFNPPVEAGTAYAYRLQACDIRGCGEPSDPFVVQVAPSSLLAPANVTAEPRSGTEVILRWESDASDARFLLDVSFSTGEPVGPPIAIDPGNRSYLLGKLQPQRAYKVRLQACTSAGCSPHSTEVAFVTPGTLTAADLRGVLPPDPIRQSVVDGLGEAASFGPSRGEIRASYQPDRVRLSFAPAEGERFLVVNELYHPAWHAYAGGAELPILPTNIVMRGIRVPPGVAEIDLRYQPFFTSLAARLAVVVGGLLGVVGWVVLRWLDGGRAAGGAPEAPAVHAFMERAP